MKDAGLVSKQPGAHAYKVARAERPDIPNLLAREFAVPQPNHRLVCCFTPTGEPIRQSSISTMAVALSHDPEHESVWQLLG